jgi:hypothetical protein
MNAPSKPPKRRLLSVEREVVVAEVDNGTPPLSVIALYPPPLLGILIFSNAAVYPVKS